MNKIVSRAVSLWGMTGATWTLAAARENQVYCVVHQGERYALRVHRRGYRTDDELRSELQWMAVVSRGGLLVPSPVPATDTALFHRIDDVQIDVLTWLTGAPFGSAGEPLNHADRSGVFRAIGCELARLHAVSDTWTPPPDFTRWAWDRAGLVGDAPLWGRFWDNSTLTGAERTRLLQLRKAAQHDLVQMTDSLDYGLIHADLVRENIMVDGDQLKIIDFDDGGFGFRLFDIATALRPNRDEADYDELKAALLAGYNSIREINLSALDLMMALRAATYVGWIMSRMEEHGSKERNRRFINTAIELAENYLVKRVG